MPDLIPLPSDYGPWLAELKAQVHAAQQRAARSVNSELVLLYWQIGRGILERQGREGWGSKVIERLAQDLRNAFPTMKGISRANLLYMRAFADAWPDQAIVQQAVGQLPCDHKISLLDRLTSDEQGCGYGAKAIEHNWSRNVLMTPIERRLLERSGQAVTNGSERLQSPMSDLSRKTFKAPDRLDLLRLGQEAFRRVIEQALADPSGATAMP